MAAGSPAQKFEIAAAAGRWDEACSIARRELTRREGNQGWAAMALARCAAARNDFAEMRRWLDRAARTVKITADFREFAASMLLSAGDPAAALGQFGDDETDPAARILGGTVRATALVMTGRAAEAAALVEALLKRHPIPEDAPITALARHLGLGGAAIPARIEGLVEIEGRKLHGWVASPVTVRLEHAVSGSLELTPKAETDEDGKPRFGFALDLGESGLAPGRIAVTAGGFPLAGSPIAWRRRGEEEIHPVRAIPRRKQKAAPAADPIVDVVIPVHGGREVTLACLGQVLATCPPGSAEIVVIDDASPDPALSAALDGLAAEKRITLLRNETNLGFPASVNRGMALHKKRDVVLLNSDAQVFPFWLERLKNAAYAADDTGTATALSNEASICSYGAESGEDWAALDRLAAEANAGITVELPTAVGFCMYIRRDCLAETGLFSETLFGRGYGEENEFCLRARRFGWRHVAAADVYAGHVGGASFGAGGSLLQRRNIKVLERLNPGYQKLVERFIAADPLAPARRALDLARWKRQDGRPAMLLVTLSLEGGASRHVEERRAALAAAGWRVLLLAPAAPRREGKREFQRCRLSDPEQPHLKDMLFDSESEMALLAELLAAAPVAGIEFHHSLKHHPAVLDLPARLKLPYEVVLHDYHWLCPQVALTDESGSYCGEPQPSLPHCEACRIRNGSESGEDITVEGLRRRSARLLQGASRIVAPARDVADRYRRYFPAITPEVVPWDDVQPPSAPRPPHPPHPLTLALSPPWERVRFSSPSPLVGEGRGEGTHEESCEAPPRHARAGGHPESAAPTPARMSVCVIGAIGPHKGYDVLKACAEDAAARDLPLDFVVVGYSSDDGPLFATGRIHITGRYKEEEAEALVRSQNADYAFIPSVCPETWCYALSLAWKAGLEVAAFDLGAPAERLRAKGGGVVLPFGLEPAAINDTLLAQRAGFMIDDKTSPPTQPAQEEASMTQITATPQEMTLTPGFYAITVIRGSARPRPGKVALPAILVSTPPAVETRAEILSSHAGGWLTRQGDTVMLKVTGDTPILLTSYKDAEAPAEALEIQFSRVDGPAMGVAAAPAPQPLPVPAAEIVAHVQRLGDQRYASGAWAGNPGQGMAIEGFAISPTAGISAHDIEYKAVTSQGWETPWITGGQFCGTRAQATPLIGLAVRLKGPAAERFDCQYEAVFINGGRSGPVRNGMPCRSEVIGAPLEGILLTFSARG